MVICLATGAALDAAIGPHHGKGSGELGLVRRLLEGFRPGDVMLADALYCNYFLIASLMAKGVDVRFEQNGSRITDFRRGQSLGTRDHIVRWPKPMARPQWMTPGQYAHAPDELTLREVKIAHHVLVTTRLDHRQVSKSDLSALYARRWNVELDLRNLKTTTGMDVLSCQTPSDPLGRRDLPEPANVRSDIMASTQHSSAALPLPQTEPFGLCEQQPNPNPQQMTMRALLQAMVGWIKEGREPPPSKRPTIAAGNLVAASEVKFPAIPANHYGGVARKAVRFLANSNPLFAQDYGPQFRPGEAAGVMTQFPPKLGTQAYRNLVAQVDADGNDLGGIRSVFVQVPLGTYTGWNVYHDALFKDGICTLSGSFIPSPRRARSA